MVNVEFCLFDIDYAVEDGKPVVMLWGEKKDGKSVLALDRSFEPYFYIELEKEYLKSNELENLKRRVRELKEFAGKVKNIEMVERRYLGERKTFLKVVLSNPRDIPDLREIIKEWRGIRNLYEYDISFYRRYLIDKGLVPMGWVSAEGEKGESELAVDEVFEIGKIEPSMGEYPKFRIMAIDIEMCGDEIIMISMVSKGFRKVLTYGWKEEGRKYVEILKNEEEMIKRFIGLVKERNPDIIVTYNGDLFDFAKLRDRAEHYKIPLTLGRDNETLTFARRGRVYSARMTGRVHVDLYNFVFHILESSLLSETLTLDMVSNELLGVGKKPLEWRDIEKIWKEKKGLNKISKYCEWDSELTLKLSERLLFQIFELCKIVGQSLFDVTRMSYSQLVEWLLIRNAHKKDEMALNRPKFDEIKRRREASPYLGGYVLPPEPGIHQNIALFDFASLYPSTTITHNISPETLDKDGEGKENKVPESEHFFSLGKKGFIPEIIEGLVKKRMEIKSKMSSAKPDSPVYMDLYNMQYALKILANASYGYYAYAGSRWYSRICAMSIAAFGRYYIQKVINFAKEKGFRVIYGDTDSLFLADCSDSKAKELLEEVNGILPETMELEFENIYKSGIFVPTKTGTTAKKRYALLDRNDKMTIRGFEHARRDWCKTAKDTQEKVLLAILKDRDKDKAIKIVRDVIDKINKGKVKIKDLVMYTQITRPLDKYEQIGPHVAAAKKYVAHGHAIKEGSVIEYVISKGAGSISSRAEPFKYAENYDPEYYVNNQILPAAMRILHGLGFTEGDVLEEPPGQKSLETFMKKSLKKKLRESFEKFKGE